MTDHVSLLRMINGWSGGGGDIRKVFIAILNFVVVADIGHDPGKVKHIAVQIVSFFKTA